MPVSVTMNMTVEFPDHIEFTRPVCFLVYLKIL